jgi:hypothetical protein
VQVLLIKDLDVETSLGPRPSCHFSGNLGDAIWMMQSKEFKVSLSLSPSLSPRVQSTSMQFNVISTYFNNLLPFFGSILGKGRKTVRT